MSALLLVPAFVVLAWVARKDPLHGWSGGSDEDSQ